VPALHGGTVLAGAEDCDVSVRCGGVKNKEMNGGKMKTRLQLIIAGLLAVLVSPCSSQAKDLKDLKVLYVGSERTKEFVPFLKKYVAQVESRNRYGFNPSDAAAFDVLLLDWPQGQETRDMTRLKSPFGSRDEWNRPTVLLGSAGLNLAVAWKLKGGSGCTCMDPLAYDLRSHEIFERPYRIDRATAVRIPTPPDFQREIKAAEIEVLPLVQDYKRIWNPGWCSYSYDFARNPDVEFFCGGVNHKTPTAAGLWRQGNLLHFGFEQSPVEMNESGQHLLLNAIAYISRFTEDRPIAVTASVFAGPVARSRASIGRWLRNPEFEFAWLKDAFQPQLWATLEPMGREKMTPWADQNSQFLHPDSNQQLELDQDLVALGIPFDEPEFLTRTIADLRAGGPAAEHAQRLLHRYVPCGPRQATVDDWATWWNAEHSYLFASDAGDYCWYLDPLAIKRGVPSKDLRGPKRADSPSSGSRK
jgi:hypothetical protein